MRSVILCGFLNHKDTKAQRNTKPVIFVLFLCVNPPPSRLSKNIFSFYPSKEGMVALVRSLCFVESASSIVNKKDSPTCYIPSLEGSTYRLHVLLEVRGGFSLHFMQPVAVCVRTNPPWVLLVLSFLHLLSASWRRVPAICLYYQVSGVGSLPNSIPNAQVCDATKVEQ